METLEEFDSEYPLVLSFCERISPQDYEGQGLSYTQKSLQELFTQMERKPSICERVVRKRKQAENERGSLGQYLKVRGPVTRRDPGMGRGVACPPAAKTSSWRPAERRRRRPILMGGFSPMDAKLWDSGLPAMPKIFGSFPKQGSCQQLPHLVFPRLWPYFQPHFCFQHTCAGQVQRQQGGRDGQGKPGPRYKLCRGLNVFSLYGKMLRE
ncbi:hypothetical protein E2320_012743 [Naja naja]|nr:hypothetical protein E2320_012743 [Naja naja]